MLNAPSAHASLGQVQLFNVVRFKNAGPASASAKQFFAFIGRRMRSRSLCFFCCLHTQHDTEDVWIHSIRMETEETRMMEVDDGEDATLISVPTQFHLTPLPESLSLGPGQFAFFPVTLLPRFPSVKAPFQGVLEDNNKYEIRSTFEVETDWGRVTIPVRATTQRTNFYDVPDMIVLQDPSDWTDNQVNHAQHTLSEEEEEENGGGGVWKWNDVAGTAVAPSVGSCYDLHISADLVERPLQVTKLVLIKSQRLSLSVRNASADSQSRTLLRSGTLPLQVPAYSNAHYVVTVCVHEEPIPVDADHDTCLDETWMWYDDDEVLGVLQMETTEEIFYITVCKTLSPAEHSMTVEYVESNENIQKDDELVTLGPQSVLTPIPSRMDFSFISPETLVIEQTLRVYTTVGSPVMRLMRAAVALDANDKGRETQYGVRVEIRPHSSADREAINLPDELEGMMLQETLTLQVFLDWSQLRKKLAEDGSDSVSFTGQAVIMGTTSDHDYTTWNKMVKENPQIDFDLKLEVPLTTQVRLGKMGFHIETSTHPLSPLISTKVWDEEDATETLSMAFFPKSPVDFRPLQNDGLLDMEQLVLLDHLDHRLRVFSNVPLVQISRIDIVMSESAPLQNMSESLCHRFEVSIPRKTKHVPPLSVNNVTDLGPVLLRYRFPSETDRSKSVPLSFNEMLPTYCQLSVITEPDTGLHLLPLIIYPGQLDVSASPYRSEIMADGLEEHPEDDNAIWNRVIVGYEQLLNWFQNTKAGLSLRSVLDASLDSRKHPERDGVLLGRYLYRLAQKSVDLKNSKLRPMLIKAGAIPHGQVETLPLYLTNHNPVPIKITIDVREVEGMSITLGRDGCSRRGDGNSIVDFFPHKPRSRVIRGKKVPEPRLRDGPLAGQPVNALRQFLLSDRATKLFFERFPYRDAVTLSDMATTKHSILRELFKATASVNFHSTASFEYSFKNTTSRCDASVNPPLYGSFVSRLQGRRMPGPIIISNDGRTLRCLPVCWDMAMETETVRGRGSGPELVQLPPGGVARFDIRVRSPPRNVLESDITQFLATGLVLSTDHGEVLPILVSFAALQGTLEVSRLSVPSTNNSAILHREGVIQVPIGLFAKQSTDTPSPVRLLSRGKRSSHHLDSDFVMPQESPADERTIPLFMRSTFNRDLKVVEISSCNPWFKVTLVNNTHEENADSFLGVNVGAISSVVPCQRALNIATGEFPSFFRCVLSWLDEWRQLQPRGCGVLALDRTDTASRRNEGRERLEEGGGMKRAVQAFNRALHVTEYFHNVGAHEVVPTNFSNVYKSGKRYSDGLVSEAMIDAVSGAWNAWKAISKSGVRSLSTSLRAVVEYNTSDYELSPLELAAKGGRLGKNRLAVALRNLTIETILDVPRLFDERRAGKFGRYAPSSNDDAAASIFEFPPLLVGEVSSLHLPLKNPTGVPVRVRLAVFGERKRRTEPLLGDIDRELFYQTRSSYISDQPSPYVQTGVVLSQQENTTAKNPWWEASRGFFAATFYGHVIHSYQNLTLRSGRGAYISIHNPGLLASSAFLVGCGSRCGIKGDVPAHVALLLSKSPIGASSGFGERLLGRKRFPLVEANRSNDEDGESVSEQGLLQPFALSFSSLDEIVIPPYGEAELGPIFFRPPNKVDRLSRDLEKSLGHPNKVFESMLFLENSLTGLERVQLRGEALWEKIAFLDLTPVNSVDDFGDLEMRYGRSTLMFEGTSRKATAAQSNVKGFVIRNDGDTAASFENIFFSDVHSLLRDDQQFKAKCGLANFRLLECGEQKVESENFRLLPGENKTFYIEYRPTCRRQKNYIALNFMYDRRSEGHSSSEEQQSIPSISDTLQHRNYFRPSREVVLLGYEMSKKQFSNCMVFRSNIYGEKATDVGDLVTVKVNGNLHLYGNENGNILLRIALCFGRWMTIAGIISTTIFQCVRKIKKREQNAGRFFYIISRKGCKVEKRLVDGSNWYPAFRCLTRSDPTSSDLQALGREQIRHVVLARYRSSGILLPQCFNTAGIFHRERQSDNPQTEKVKLNAGGERMRTLSDAIFRRFDIHSTFGLFPVEVGWRTALARGIIDASSFPSLAIFSVREQLLLQRSRGSPLSLQDDNDDENGVENAQSSEDDSSALESFHVSNGDSTDFGKDTGSVDLNLPSDLRRSPIVFKTVSSRADQIPPQSDRSIASSIDGNFTDNEAHSFDKTNTERRENDIKGSVRKDYRIPNDSVVCPDQMKSMSQPNEVQEKRASNSGRSSKDGQRINAAQIGISSVTPEENAFHSKECHHQHKATLPPELTQGRKPERLLTHEYPNVHPSAGSPSGVGKTGKVVFRQPAGLDPPPGFEANQTLHSFDVSSATASESPQSSRSTNHAPVRVPREHSQHESSDTIIGSLLEESSASADHFRRNGKSVSSFNLNDHNALATAESRREPLYSLSEKPETGGFDVMDFLDGILSERDQQEELDVQQTLLDPLSSVGMKIAPVLSNPWAAGDNHRSRAAAYGIAFDDENEKSNEYDSSANFPLLTPAMLAQEMEEESVDPRVSFYANLLGE
jgi:hypothetical protein